MNRLFLRYCHTLHRVFAVQTSCSGSNTIATLTEMLLCLFGGFFHHKGMEYPCYRDPNYEIIKVCVCVCVLCMWAHPLVYTLTLFSL